MNYLITGANGFLGTTINKYFLDNNYSVFTLSRNSGNYRISLEKEIPIFNIYFNTVIHAAGLAHVISRKQLEKNQFFKVNVTGTKNLLIGLEKSFLPKHFVFISSVSVYGLKSGSNIDENNPLLAKDPYGTSKIQAENIVLNWCKKNNVICTILRLPLVVNINPPGNLGSMISSINKGYYFNISGGKSKKSMVLADDIAKHIIKVANIGGIYNLTDGYHPSVSELSDKISVQFSKSKPKSVPFWFAYIVAIFFDLIGYGDKFNMKKLSKITSSLTFDDSKARKSFGWKPSNVLDFLNNNQITTN